MTERSGDPEPRSTTRRSVLKKAGIAAGAVWAAPVVMSVSTPAAAQSACGCASAPVQFSEAQPQYRASPGPTSCGYPAPGYPPGVNTIPVANQLHQATPGGSSNFVPVCRSSPTQRVFFANASNGLYEPYVDDLAYIVVRPPGGTGSTDVVGTFRRWVNSGSAANCPVLGSFFFALTADPGIGGGTGQNGEYIVPTTTVPAVDITDMFGAACGVFGVQMTTANADRAYAWTELWIVPE